ncbi:MAG: MBOAT family protein, partial [Clostridiales bacterium]|nr:MBOAT family protein [Clostridiales bacterium]
KRPYFATSVDDFWRRWHISLGDWMKDYLFYPLALSGWLPRLSKKLRPYLSPRVGKLVTPSIATVIVFLMVGIWQGPGGHNIAFGLWNGLLMSGAMLLAPYFDSITKKMRIRENGKILYVYRILRTAFLVVIGRYFSRALSLTAAFGMLARTVTSFTKNLSLSSFFSFGLDKWDYLTVLISVLVLLTVSILQERGIKARAAFVKLCPGIQFILLFIAVSLLVTCVYLNSDYTAIAYVYENV